MALMPAGLDACIADDGLAAAGAGERRITAAGLVPGAGDLIKEKSTNLIKKLKNTNDDCSDSNLEGTENGE